MAGLPSRTGETSLHMCNHPSHPSATTKGIEANLTAYRMRLDWALHNTPQVLRFHIKMTTTEAMLVMDRRFGIALEASGWTIPVKEWRQGSL